jgi:peroxiredoxin/glutaredoxin
MFRHREGQPVPDVTFRSRQDGRWQHRSTHEVFGGRTVIVFALPGAFTPTCSRAHAPRYDELAPLFRAHGVDEIVCLSVNDAFVMDAWRLHLGSERVTFIADGNADFTRAMGMLVDKRDLGFGDRSWRYSMLVRDATIEKMFIEPDREGDPYEVSDADTMLRYVAPGATAPPDIVMFTRRDCSACARAKRLVRECGWEFEELPASPRRLRAVAGATATPQVFIDGRYIGGADELAHYLEGLDAANLRHAKLYQ